MSRGEITYADLNAIFRKSFRNGNWRKQRFVDKALYRAAMWYGAVKYEYKEHFFFVII